MTRLYAFRFFAMLIALIAALPASAASDLTNSVFVPISPCKVGDTRPSFVIAANAFVEWAAYGADLSAQGGSAGGCLHPKPEQKPVAIAVTVNAIGSASTGNGNLQVYPADGGPGGVTVVYTQGTNTANSTIVGLCNNGSCDGKFRVESRQADIPVSAIVTGYFYAKAARQATVANSGGDYSSITAALDDSAAWCPSPSAVNRCVVNVAPGLYYESGIQLKSYISVQGSGPQDTSILAYGAPAAEQPVFIMDGVSNLNLSNLYAAAIGNAQVADVRAIEISETAGFNTNVYIMNAVIIAAQGTGESFGIFMSGNGIPSEGSVSVRESIVYGGQGGLSAGIALDSSADTLYVNDTAVIGDGAGLGIGGPHDFTGSIDGSTFSGGIGDIYLAEGPVTATIRHSHLSNGTVFKDTGSEASVITCLFVTGGNNMLDRSCAGDVLNPGL